MNGRRVVVTGLGLVTPVGHTVADSWSAILAGRSGVAPIDAFDVEAYSTRFSASVRDFDTEPYFSSKDARKMDIFVQYGMAAGIQAFEDSGFEITDELDAVEDMQVLARHRWRRRMEKLGFDPDSDE